MEPSLFRGQDGRTAPPSSGLSLSGWQLDVPGEVQPGKHADDPETGVELPPAQAVPGRGREGVVRVVPALPQRQDAEQVVVAALIVAAVGPEAPPVADGVHAPGNVVDQEDPDQ